MGSGEKHSYYVRRSTSRGTPSYQYGHYEMKGKPGERRSAFRVDVHLGEHSTPEGALEAWPEQVRRLRRAGREVQAVKLGRKLEKLQEIVRRGEDNG